MRSSCRRILFSGFLFFTFFKAEVSAQSTEPLFWLGDQPHSTEEFIYAYNKNRNATNASSSQDDLSAYFDLYVKFKLKVAAAHNQGYAQSSSFRQEMEGYRLQLAKPYLTESIVTEELVEEAYQRTLEEVEASHILLEVPANAAPEDTLRIWNQLLDIKKRVEAGEPFPELAKQLSHDPSARKNNGYLGFFSAFQMVYPFEDAAFQTTPGTVSAPFRSNFGYHIVYVHSRRKALGSFRLAHIFLRSNPADSTISFNRATEIKERINKGEDWNELVRRFSDEASNKEKGGELPWLTVRQLPPSFAAVVIQMETPGAISDPLYTEAGWHILKLLEKKPVPPLGEVRDMIEARIAKDERAVKMNARASESLIEKLDAQIDVQNLQQALLQISSDSLTRGIWAYNSSQPFLNNRLLIHTDTLLLVKDFYQFVKLNANKREGIAPTSYADQLWEQFLFAALQDLEIRDLRRKNSDYRFLFNEYYEGTLLFEIMNDKIWQFANSDTTGIKKYFETNRKKYMWEERAKATIVSAQPGLVSFIGSGSRTDLYLLHREEIDSLQSIDKVFSSFREILKSRGISEDSIVPVISGEERVINEQIMDKTGVLYQSVQVQPKAGEKVTIEWMTGSEKVMEKFYNHSNPLSLKVSKALFERSEGAIPDKFWKEGFSLDQSESLETGYFVHRILPPAEKTLDEIRGKVVSDYQEHLESEWVKELEKRYPLKVNSKAWKNVVKTISN